MAEINSQDESEPAKSQNAGSSRNIRFRLAAAFALQVPLAFMYGQHASTQHIPTRGAYFGIGAVALSTFIGVTLFHVFREGSGMQKIAGAALLLLPVITLLVFVLWLCTTLL